MSETDNNKNFVELKLYNDNNNHNQFVVNIKENNNNTQQIEQENKRQVEEYRIHVIPNDTINNNDKNEYKYTIENHCFKKCVFTAGEIIFYPELAVILSLLINIFGSIICVVLGAFGFIMLAFIPFACIYCCCGDNGKDNATIYITVTCLLIFVFFAGIFSFVTLPFVILYDFIMTYVKICKQEISWKKPIKTNISNLVNHSKRIIRKTYTFTIEKIKSK
jgi:hypothetical protein